jgi:WD40 repeat protein
MMARQLQPAQDGTGEPSHSTSSGGQLVRPSSSTSAVPSAPAVTIRSPSGLNAHPNHERGLAFHPGGKLLATASWDRTVRLWGTTPESQAVRVFDFPSGRGAWCAAFTPEGCSLAVGNPNGTVYVLRLAQPGKVFTVPGDQQK